MKKLRVWKVAWLGVLCACLLGTPALYAAPTAFDMVISAGTPQIGSGEYTTTGNVYFVDSGHEARRDSADNGTYDKPFATLDYAIGRCTASNGDIIFVAPGHAESFTAADGFDVDVAGVRIVGLGEGANRPTFTFADTDATVAVGAANVTIENVRFLAGISDIVKGIAVEVGGDNFMLKNCDFPKPTTATFEFLDAVDLASGADNGTIINCTYYGAATSLTNHFLEAGTGVNVGWKVLDNFVWGNFAVSGIWSNKADLDWIIARNVISNATAGQHAIEFTSTATGMIVDNRLYTNAYATSLDPGSMYCLGNLYSSGIDTGGQIVPADSLLGTLTDAAASGAVTNTDTIMAYIKQLVTEGIARDAAITTIDDFLDTEIAAILVDTTTIGDATLPINPTAGSLARFVASGGTALGTQLADSKSLVDALGTNGTTPVDAATSVLGAIGVNDADNAMDTGTVASNRDGSVFERLEHLNAGKSGEYLMVTSSVTSSSIPNNTQVAGAITGASSGGLVLVNVFINTDAMGLANPTNIEFSVDNAAGKTGAAAPIILEATAGLGANVSWNAEEDSTTDYLPVYLEPGKIVYIHGDDNAGTGAGVATITMLFQRVTDGATIAGANLP